MQRQKKILQKQRNLVGTADDKNFWWRGKIVGKILAVIYTERGENYRIISARLADKKEVTEYYGQYQNL